MGPANASPLLVKRNIRFAEDRSDRLNCTPQRTQIPWQEENCLKAKPKRLQCASRSEAGWPSCLCCADRAVSSFTVHALAALGYLPVQPWLPIASFLSFSLAFILFCLTRSTQQQCCFPLSRLDFLNTVCLVHLSTPGLIRHPLGRLQQCLRGCLKLLHQQGVHGSLARTSLVTTYHTIVHCAAGQAFNCYGGTEVCRNGPF